MFFNFIGHRPSVDNIIERMFAFVDSPRERPWVAMGGLAIFILIGAVWVNQAQVLPGVSISETGLSGSVVDIMWDSDGDQALALVENGNDLEMMIRDSQGTWSALDCNCNVTSIGGTESQWVAGGEDGWIGIMNAGSTSISPRSFNWPDTTASCVVGVFDPDEPRRRSQSFRIELVWTRDCSTNIVASKDTPLAW